jgi:nicotinamidase-related amidase
MVRQIERIRQSGHTSVTMTDPFTLRDAAGLPDEPTRLDESILVVIDAQHEYSSGPLALPDIDPATENIARLLERARAIGSPIIHVAHRGRPGGSFDPDAGGRIIETVAPAGDEIVVAKTKPNGFADTDLAERIEQLGSRPLIVTGFMTHMCVSATARSALDHGFDTTVVSDATATRDLPAPDDGDALSAITIHRAALAGLADRFSVVATTGAVLEVSR